MAITVIFECPNDTLAQLDQLMPVADRQKAVALAQAKAKQAPPPSSKPKASRNRNLAAGFTIWARTWWVS